MTRRRDEGWCGGFEVPLPVNLRVISGDISLTDNPEVRPSYQEMTA
jgi:hypothetical protein